MGSSSRGQGVAAPAPRGGGRPCRLSSRGASPACRPRSGRPSSRPPADGRRARRSRRRGGRRGVVVGRLERVRVLVERPQSGRLGRVGRRVRGAVRSRVAGEVSLAAARGFQRVDGQRARPARKRVRPARAGAAAPPRADSAGVLRGFARSAWSRSAWARWIRPRRLDGALPSAAAAVKARSQPGGGEGLPRRSLFRGRRGRGRGLLCLAAPRPGVVRGQATTAAARRFSASSKRPRRSASSRARVVRASRGRAERLPVVARRRIGVVELLEAHSREVQLLDRGDLAGRAERVPLRLGRLARGRLS